MKTVRGDRLTMMGTLAVGGLKVNKIMKALKKGKKYARVQPLPDEWYSPKSIALKSKAENGYQSSFRKLSRLLDDGWEFCGKAEMRKFEKSKTRAEKPNKKTKKDKR